MRVLALLLLLLAAPLAAQQVPAPASSPAPSFTPALAAETLEAVRAASAEGLDPSDYGEARLAAALAGTDAAAIDAAARASWLALARDYAAGRTPEAARRGWRGPGPRADEAFLAGRLSAALAAASPRAHLEGLLPTHPDYAALRAALAAATAADRPLIRANLDRWRWFPRQPGERYLLVNIPAFELKLVEGGQTLATHRVIVGKPATPTLSFSTVATGVILNPKWVVPRSIIAESVGALIARSPAAARARGYRWTGSGPTLSVVQGPGPTNSLGQVKLDMPNPHSIFIHDTPARALFDRQSRAFSHGCIRTDKALDLAARLLADVPGLSRPALDSMVATGQTQRVALSRQVPVHIVYLTATPGPGGTIRRLPDLYGRDAAVISALGPGPALRTSERTAEAGAEAGCYAEMPNRPA
ncbi:MAG: L,D-transpeptidase family protein [Sphingomonadaceae bacterium]